MKETSIAIAYPTIPIIFLGGIKASRVPLYDTMGLAVTNLDETTRTETRIESLQINDKIQNSSTIKFYLGDKEISGKRGNQIIANIKKFLKKNGFKTPLKITSQNYKIFSGSSDSGLAALFTALNDFFELDYTREQLLEYSMKGSESAGRSLFGGLTHTIITNETVQVKQLASEKVLEKIKLFAVPFKYESRFSADQIHANIVKNPDFEKRVSRIPKWVKEIKNSLQKNDFINLLEIAEENIINAHRLLEGVGITVRKKEMINLCNDIHEMRKQGIFSYFLIGGGNLVTVATTEKYEKSVMKFLKDKNWNYIKYKIAGAPKILI